VFSLIPPAGAPVTFREISKIASSWARSEFGALSFEEKIRSHAGVRFCYLLNSGRSAQFLTLKALSELAHICKDEVVIPAYTCFSVAAAIARSGLKIRLVDIDPLTMDYDYDRLFDLDFSKVLAVIACNLFGILSNWERLWPIAREKEVFLIDDAAQSMGSLFKGRPSGSLGDIGFYSLNRGKNLSTFSGGILITNSERIAAKIQERMNNLTRPGINKEIGALVGMTIYSWFLHPKSYWFPNMIPFLNLGKTVFDKNFKVGHLADVQKSAGTILWRNLEGFNATRKENARKLAEGVLRSQEFKIPGYNELFLPVYLRLPLLAASKAKRYELVTALKRQGVIASTMYPSTIRQIVGVEKYLASAAGDFPGAKEVTEKLVTLPTHPYLRNKDIQKIISCFVEK